jgi:hypothetical protein
MCSGHECAGQTCHCNVPCTCDIPCTCAEGSVIARRRARCTSRQRASIGCSAISPGSGALPVLCEDPPRTLIAVHLHCALWSFPRGVCPISTGLSRVGVTSAAVGAAGTGRHRGGRTTTWRACGTTSTFTTTSWPTPRAWCTTSTQGAHPVPLQHMAFAICSTLVGSAAARLPAHMPKQDCSCSWQIPGDQFTEARELAAAGMLWRASTACTTEWTTSSSSSHTTS